MTSWPEWIVHGDSYLKFVGTREKPTKFNDSIKYNMAGMALESYVMAILDYNHTLPENHTFTDLIDALETVYPLAPELRTKILKSEKTQEICSFENYKRKDISADDLFGLAESVAHIGTVAHEICGE